MIEPKFNNFDYPKIEPPKFETVTYEDTMLKDMANDIVASQSKIEDKLDNMIDENKKSGKTSFKFALWTLLIALLTLIATIVGFFI